MSETRILLADDDDVGRYVIATMLRRAGFTVAETTDGAQALEAAIARPPDLVVLDVKMPGMDGFEACRHLKSHEATHDVPVLMLSATFLDSETRVEGLETGADAYLTQPVEAPVLAATIRALLRTRSAESEVRLAAKEWSATFDAISDAVAVLAPDGSLLRANRSFRALFDGQETAPALTELVRCESGDELDVDARIFRVRVDRLVDEEDPALPERLVVTLSDITAARAAEHERAAALSTEQTISRTLQQSLLPERLPDHPHLELHAWHVAAETELIVGGDWYDVIDTADGLWLVMGDIAGHGVVAAAQAGQLRHSLRVYAHEGYGLVESVERLNELVLNTGLTQMATLCVVAIDRDASVARFALAGHPPPLVVPRDGAPHFAEGGLGAVLGISGATYSESSVELAPGDCLVLYTDGLVERPGEPIDQGLDRMRRHAQGADGLEALRRRLVQELSGVSNLRDDVALLLARRV